MITQQTQFLTEYEALCKRFKIHITSNMYHELELFDYNDDALLIKDADEDIRLHIEEIRNNL